MAAPDRDEWAKVEHGKITAVGLPESGELRDGRPVSNYYMLEDTVLRREGWQVVDDPGQPPLDPSLHAGVLRDVVLRGGRPVAEYRLVPAEQPEPVQTPPQPPDEDIHQLKDVLGTHLPAAQNRTRTVFEDLDELRALNDELRRQIVSRTVSDEIQELRHLIAVMRREVEALDDRNLVLQGKVDALHESNNSLQYKVSEDLRQQAKVDALEEKLLALQGQVGA